MSETLMQSLETRRHFAVDFSVTLTVAGTDAPRYALPSVATKFTAMVGVINGGDKLGKGVKPADVKVVLRPNAGGTDVLVGTVKGAPLASLANRKSKLAKVACTIPVGAATGDYTLTVLFDGASIGDTVAGNNTSIYNESTTITATPPGALDHYNLGSVISFTKTSDGEAAGVGGSIHELGNFKDNRGHTGTYEFVVGLGIGSLSFEFSGSQNSPDFYVTYPKAKSLNKRTVTFSIDNANTVGNIKDVGTGGVVYIKK